MCITNSIIATMGYALLAAGSGDLGYEAMRQAAERMRDLPYTDTVFCQTRYASLEQWQARRAWLREQVKVAVGLVPEPPRTPLNAQIFGKIVRDGYSVEKVYFECLPGVYVTGNLYRPTNLDGQAPAVACPHGHWSRGRINHDDTCSVPARCITLARLGAVVFAYDMIGYLDSHEQFPHDIDSPERALWGLSAMAIQTWSGVRALDFLLSLPEVDPQRLAVTGASGGGTQAFILSAIDDRVQVAAPVNMISSTMQGGCPCENSPLLRIGTNNMEIGALFAPKPLLLISASGDWTSNTPQVEYPMIRGVYELYGASGKIHNFHVDAPHNYNQTSREAMYRFFGRWLFDRSDTDSITEGAITVEKDEDLLVWAERELPDNAVNLEQLTAQWKRMACARIEALRPGTKEHLADLEQLVRMGLKHIVASDYPALEKIGVRMAAPHLVYERDGQAVLVFATRRMSTGLPHPSRLIISEGGGMYAPGVQAPPVSLVRVQSLPPAAYLPSVVFDESQDIRQQSAVKFFVTFNRTPAAMTIFNLLTAIQAESVQSDTSSVQIVGGGPLGPACLIARAMIPPQEAEKMPAVIDMNGWNGSGDEEYMNKLYLPMIQRIGGLEVVAAVAANGPIWLHNLGEGFDSSWIVSAGKLNGVEVKITRTPAAPQEINEWLSRYR
ncbi:MAG: hypothetical protein GXY44_10630 [Phycisphaerales bacterium]|nr:hypothetical protein [Phycisphaerales bacterium]